jgi:hypothetical protein
MRDYILLSTILDSEKSKWGQWQFDFLEGALDRVINKKPFIEIDIYKIIEKLQSYI